MKPSEWLGMVAAQFEAGARTLTAAADGVPVDATAQRVAEAYLTDGLQFLIETGRFPTDAAEFPAMLTVLCRGAALLAAEDGR